MKIIVSAKGKGLDAQVDERFGRCPYFVCVDTDNMTEESIDNPGTAAAGGAGIVAAEAVLALKPGAILTGEVGPHAAKALASSGVEVVMGAAGTVREAIEKYKSKAHKIAKPISGL